MKITVNINNIDFPTDTAFEKAKQYLSKHNVDVDWNFKKIKVTGYSTYHQPAPLDRWLIRDSHNFVNIDYASDMNMFVFNHIEWATPKGSQFPLKPETPNGSCFLLNGKPFINVGFYKEGDWVQVAHEIVHGITYMAHMKGLPIPDQMDTYLHDADPDHPDGNFARQWKLLSNFLMPMYKYFKPYEIVNLKHELVKKLDEARGLAGVPFKITSGFRSPAQNAAVGGVQDSAHETGLAVDLLVKDSISGEKINAALHKVGFQRFGYYRDNHIHVDCDLSKPHPVYWIK